MIMNVYTDIVKIFTRDEEVNGEEAEWKTVNGNHIAVGEGGEIVAGGVPGTDLDEGNDIDEVSANVKKDKARKFKQGLESLKSNVKSNVSLQSLMDKYQELKDIAESIDVNDPDYGRIQSALSEIEGKLKR